jgi:hypothetical protein
MIDMGKVVREALASEVALMLSDCERIRKGIDHVERELPTISDRHERAAARIDLLLRRAKLAAVVSELQGDDLIEKFSRLAKKRYPSWRM